MHVAYNKLNKIFGALIQLPKKRVYKNNNKYFSCHWNSVKNLKKANIEVVNAVTYLRLKKNKNIITEQITFLAEFIILKNEESTTVILHLIYRVSKWILYPKYENEFSIIRYNIKIQDKFLLAVIWIYKYFQKKFLKQHLYKLKTNR